MFCKLRNIDRFCIYKQLCTRVKMCVFFCFFFLMIKLSKKQSQQSLLAIAGVWFVYGLAGDSDGSIWLFVVAGFAAPWFGTVKRLFKEHYDQTGSSI